MGIQDEGYKCNEDDYDYPDGLQVNPKIYAKFGLCDKEYSFDLCHKEKRRLMSCSGLF